MAQVKLGSQACTGTRRLDTSGSSTEKRSCYKRQASSQASESTRGKDELLEVKLQEGRKAFEENNHLAVSYNRKNECKGKQKPTP